jgi:5'-deoxynucleotidase YfbR-like HD superfamily hydrolase
MPLLKSVELLLAGSNTKRFHTVPTINNETIGHHTALVSGLVYILFPDCSRNLLINALYHDVAECVTGDIPSPIKRKLGLNLNAVEDEIVQEHGLHIPEISDKERRDLKCADILVGMLECLHESRMGNTMVKVAFKNFAAYFLVLDHPNMIAQKLYSDILEEYATY